MPATPLRIATFAVFFEAADLAPMVAAAGESRGPTPAADYQPEQVAHGLNGGALALLYGRQDADPPGVVAEWARAVEDRTDQLLAAFEHGHPGALPQVAALFGAYPMRLLDAHLPVPSLATLQQLVTQLRTLRATARVVSQAFASEVTGRKVPNVGEATLVRTLADAYEGTFGRPPGVSTNRETGERSGPGIRYCLAAVQHLVRRLEDADVDVSADARASLQSLQDGAGLAARLKAIKKARRPDR